jgi:hypothetical protein
MSKDLASKVALWLLLMIDFIRFLSSYVHFFITTYVFSDTCYLGSNGSTKFLESTIVFDSFLEGRSSTNSRMLCSKRFWNIRWLIKLNFLDSWRFSLEEP